MSLQYVLKAALYDTMICKVYHKVRIRMNWVRQLIRLVLRVGLLCFLIVNYFSQVYPETTLMIYFADHSIVTMSFFKSDCTTPKVNMEFKRSNVSQIHDVIKNPKLKLPIVYSWKTRWPQSDQFDCSITKYI